MSTVVKDLGAVSAYAYAVEKGYTGTEAEFAELMADYAEVGQRAEDAAESALNSKTAAQTAATTATNKANEATTAAQTATTKAGEATTAADTATTAKNDAVAAKTAAETAQGKAEDAQAAAESVAESIPSDYSQLSEDVSDLKEGLSESVSDLKSALEYNDPFEYHGNLFNFETITTGKLITSNGGEKTNSYGAYSDYIPCEANTNYTITRFRDFFGGAFVAAVFYDAIDSVVGYYADSSSQPSSAGITFTTPATCEYMRVNVSANGANSAMLVKGDTYPSAYTEYGKKYVDANPEETTREYLNGLNLALSDVADGLFEQGIIYSSTGLDYSSNYGIRTGILDKNICAVHITDDLGFVMIAAYQGGEYIGFWNGTTFAKERPAIYKIPKYIDLTQFEDYDIRLCYIRRGSIFGTLDNVSAIDPGSTDYIKIYKNTTIKDTMRMFGAGMLQSAVIDAYPDTSLGIEGTIRPVQSGTGDPSPSNVRAIGSTSSLTLTVGAKTYALPLGTAIKVGKFSLKTGKYYEQGVLKTFNGSESWRKIGTSTFYTSISNVYRAPVSNNGQSNEEFACDRYKNMPADGNGMSQSSTATQYGCCLGSPAFGQNVFVVNDPNFTTVDAWKTNLQTNNINIVYTSTATPTEYTLSDVPEILAPYGSAAVSNSVGKISVEGTAAKNNNNPLYGKKALFMGDSICYGDKTDTDHCERGWAGRIGAANNMESNNWGVSGARITDTSSGHTGGKFCISDFITTAKNAVGTDMDYIILEGGTNDADLVSDANIGTFDAADFSGEYDNTTFYGALDMLFYKATSYYPNAKIGFIVAQKMGLTSQAVTARRRSFFDKAIQACKKWGIPYIDLWNEGQINPNLTVYWDSTKTAAGNITAGSAYLDGQHLTSVGYDMISPKIEAWMKGL